MHRGNRMAKRCIQVPRRRCVDQLGKPGNTKRVCESTRLVISVEEIGRAFYVQLMQKFKNKPSQLPYSYAYQNGKAREGAVLVQEVVAERLGGMGVSTVQQMFVKKTLLERFLRGWWLKCRESLCLEMSAAGRRLSRGRGLRTL